MRILVGVIAFILLIGTAGGYETDMITTIQFITRVAILFGILIACTYKKTESR